MWCVSPPWFVERHPGAPASAGGGATRFVVGRGWAGVVEVLTELSQIARLAVVTTSRRADFGVIHQGRHILDHVEFVLVREDYVRAKPHPEPYLTALARFGARPAEALVVEDSARGLRSAVAAGVDCVVVRHDGDRAFLTWWVARW